MPCAYRLFDVDDLLTNTLGALLGSIVAWFFVPRKNAQLDPATPRPVTAGRRLLAMLCDVLFLMLVGFILTIGWRAWQMYGKGIEYDSLDQNTQSLLLIWVPLGIHFLWIMCSGQTIGESATLLRGRPAKIPVIPARVIRFLGGIGGYGILTGLSFPFSNLLLAAFVAVSLLMIFTSHGHKGLAAILAGMELEDARSSKRR